MFPFFQCLNMQNKKRNSRFPRRGTDKQLKAINDRNMAFRETLDFHNSHFVGHRLGVENYDIGVVKFFEEESVGFMPPAKKRRIE